MRIYLIRHGDPDYANDDLTERGHDEAEALAEYLASIPPAKLYTSPLGRARRTASYTEAALGKEAEVLPWTAELSLKSNDGSDQAAWNMDPKTLNDVESFAEDESWMAVMKDVGRESDAWLKTLGWEKRGSAYHRVPDAAVPKDVQVALFCHGGFGLSWLSHLLNIPMRNMWASFMLQTSSVTCILFDEREEHIATPRVLFMSALPHLYKQGLDPSPAGIVANLF